MNVFGKSFTYNGINSKKYNVVLCSFSSPDINRETGISYSINRTELTPYKYISNTYNKKYNDVLKFDIGICKCDGSKFTNAERSEIVAWITSPVHPELFTIEDYDTDGYHSNIEYFCTATDYSELVPNGNVNGLSFSMECNAAHGFSPEEITEFSSTNNIITINNTSDDLNSNYYPIVFLKGTDNGIVSLTNNRFPNEKMEINLLNGQELTIDNYLGNIEDNTDTFDYNDDTNLIWIRLAPGENIITITGNVTGYFKCRYIRKVAI